MKISEYIIQESVFLRGSANWINRKIVSISVFTQKVKSQMKLGYHLNTKTIICLKMLPFRGLIHLLSLFSNCETDTVDLRYQETPIRNFQAQLFGKFVQRSACLSQNIHQN